MCLRSTKFGVNPMIPAPDQRPRCTIDGCFNPLAISKTCKNGKPIYRKVCQPHHNDAIAKRYNKSSAKEVTAFKAGFDSVLDYTHEKHPYLRHRKKYCENIDGRLGFMCTTTIHWDGMLDVDHINSDPTDNRTINLQTLCKCCHAYKTNISKDWLTPGRKAYKLGLAKSSFIAS